MQQPQARPIVTCEVGSIGHVGVPDEHLARIAALVDEQVQLAREGIAREPLFDKPEQPVVALAQIDRLGVREDGNRTADGVVTG